MPATTLPKPRTLPVDLAHALAVYIGPAPRYAPGERAPGLALARERAGGSRLASLTQAARIRAAQRIALYR